MAATLLVATGVGNGCSRSDPPLSNCVIPTMRVAPADAASASSPVEAAAGDLLRASGEGFVDGCVAPAGAGDALQDIRIFVTQGGQRTSVARVDATGPQRSFSVRFGVPPTLAGGVARVEAFGAGDDESPVASVEFSVVVR